MLLSTINFRKLGEHSIINEKLISNKIFRSGNFNYLNADDSKYLSNNLNLRYYIDFRSHIETKKNSPAKLMESGIKWIHLPIEDYEADFKNIMFPNHYDYARYYLKILEKGEKSFYDFFYFLSFQENFPLVFGCYSGKDRTGIASVLLLNLLGFNFKDILRDYMDSSVYLIRKIDYFEHNWTKRNISKDQYIERICAKRKKNSPLQLPSLHFPPSLWYPNEANTILPFPSPSCSSISFHPNIAKRYYCTDILLELISSHKSSL